MFTYVAFYFSVYKTMNNQNDFFDLLHLSYYRHNAFIHFAYGVAQQVDIL